MNSYLENIFGVKNKTVVVIGASRGIGNAIATGFVNAGAIVFGFGRTPNNNVMNSNIFNYISEKNIDEIFLKEKFNEIYKSTNDFTVLVNAAGITLPKKHPKPDIESFQRTLDTNLLLSYNASFVAKNYMQKSEYGSIINITSIGALQGFPNNPSYIASKAALSQMTKGLAIDFSEYNIRVNNIAPGYIHTDMTDKSFQDNEKHQERQKRMIIQRWGTPDDIVGASIFLASKASSYITGSDIIIDGGWTSKGL